MESLMGKSSKEFKNVDTSLTILTTPINKNRGELRGCDLLALLGMRIYVESYQGG